MPLAWNSVKQECNVWITYLFLFFIPTLVMMLCSFLHLKHILNYVASILVLNYLLQVLCGPQLVEYNPWNYSSSRKLNASTSGFKSMTLNMSYRIINYRTSAYIHIQSLKSVDGLCHFFFSFAILFFTCNRIIEWWVVCNEPIERDDIKGH